MLREEVAVSTRTLQWKCVESRADSKHLYYGHFILSPLLKGTCITRAKFDKIPHEYSTIVGIEESVHEILMNLKEIVLRITAQDIILPPSVEIVDTTQYIASLKEPMDLCIRLKIERNRGYRMKTPNNAQDGSFTIDAVFMPVRNENHSIHSYGNGNEKQEIFFLEIWTNESLTHKEALHEASRNLIDLFIPFIHAEECDTNLEDNQNIVIIPFFTFLLCSHGFQTNFTRLFLKITDHKENELCASIHQPLSLSGCNQACSLYRRIYSPNHKIFSIFGKGVLLFPPM
ncbi:hypothetical protein MKX03_009203 [Papaver bracteatum]|nr:hypothetical protein MKX03_009203 [Papaver bracteatum]